MTSYPYAQSKIEKEYHPIATPQFIVLFIIGVALIILMIRKMK